LFPRIGSLLFLAVEGVEAVLDLQQVLHNQD
jgi:hypothetical protein